MQQPDSPESITSEEQLEEILSRPGEQLIEMMKNLEGDILVLGAGGKIGVSLSRTACRAIEAAGIEKRVIAVDLFPEPRAKELLEQYGCCGLGLAWSLA